MKGIWGKEMKFFNYKSLEVLIDNAYKFKEYGIEIDIDAINIIKTKFDKKEYRVSVLGATGSGKSTLINTILLNKGIKVLDDDKPYIRFDVANGIGSDETIEILENEDNGCNTLDDEIKNTDYVIYMMNCIYYKSAENLSILERIKVLRDDLIENNNIVFIANNIDLVDKHIDMGYITADMTRIIKKFGFKDIGILPFCAKKAFIYKLIKEDTNIDLYEKKLDVLTKVIKIEIGEDLSYINLAKDEILDKLYKESNVEVFETVILRQLYESRDELLIESLNGYEKVILKRFIDKAKPIIQSVVDKFNLKSDIELELLKKAEKIERIRDEFESAYDENNTLLRIESIEELKIKYYKNENEGLNCVALDEEIEYASSAYTAVDNGKIKFKEWKKNASQNLDIIYEHYNNIQKIGTNDESIYYFIRTRVRNNIKKFSYLGGELEKICSRDLKLDINDKFIVSVKPMVCLSYENSDAFMERIYTNDHFVSYEIKEIITEGKFGTRKKNMYVYDIKKAIEEETKDILKGRRKCSEFFFEDFYGKYINYLKELKEISDNEASKIIKVIEEFEDDIKFKLKIEDKKRSAIVRASIVDLVSIYNYLENEVQALEV